MQFGNVSNLLRWGHGMCGVAGILLAADAADTKPLRAIVQMMTRFVTVGPMAKDSG